MRRSEFFRGVRRVSPFVVLVAVLALLAGGLPALLAAPGGSHGPGLAVQAPGSQGSLHSLPWWDPRGWVGGNSAPSSTALTGKTAGLPRVHPAPQHKASGTARRVRELTAKRTAYSRTYTLSDGQLQTAVSAGPVNYRTSSGRWEPISTKVGRSSQPGYALANTTNTFRSYFGSSASNLVRFDLPGQGRVSIALPGGHVGRPSASGNTVTYANVAPGVSLSYSVTPESLTERITLASPAAAQALSALRFTVKTSGGLVPQAQKNGSIALTKGALPVLTLPAPFMTDARVQASSPYGYAWSPKVAQKTAWDAKNSTLTLSVAPDAGWLGAAARKFPVVIDPTITVAPTPTNAQNTMIESDEASTNLSTSWRLSVGTTASAAVRSLLSFPIGAVPTGTQLTSANLNLYYDQTFGPGTANQTVAAYAATGPWTASTATWSSASGLTGTTGSAAVTVNPAKDNIWDSFNVTSIVQPWVTGTSANNGFVVKATNESALNVGGPRYEASYNAYNGETATYPQLVLTYGAPGVTPNPITTIHSTGAVLSWQPYVNNTGNSGKNLAEYRVYRSVFQSFVPASNTLVSPVPAGTTTFTDTTATPTPAGGLGNAYYYMIAVKTTDGTVIPGPVQLVRLPTAGSTTQIIPASGATSLSSTQPTVNEQHITGQPWLSVGDDSATFGTTRSVLQFPSMASGGIPADASVTSANLKLWGFLNDTAAGAKYDAYELTQPFDPATATWNSAKSGTAWTTAGGTYNSTLLSQQAGFTNDPNREEWSVTSAVKDWLATPANEDGLIVKLDSSAISERELFLDTSAPAQALAPQLVVTYTEPSAADTYYAPSLPNPMKTNTGYTVPVTLTNTTGSAWTAADWVLSYHWLGPDGTDLSNSADQKQTALTADIAPGGVVTVNAAIQTPDTSSSGDARSGYQIAWDLYDKTTGTWLSSGTSTPALTASASAASTARTIQSTPQIFMAPAASSSSTKVAPLTQVTSVTRSASDLLGLEKYYQYTGVSTGSGTSLLNNDATGNTVWDYNAFSNPSRGFQTFARLDYNSMDTSESSMGFGWSLQTSTLQRLGTPLNFQPPGNPTSVTLTDGDGTTHTFTYNSSTSTWTSPPGLHYYLQNTGASGCSANGKDPVADAWTMTAPDGTQFDFDCNGYETSQTDRNGNTATFTYTQKNSNNTPVEHLDYITDPTGRQTLTISYYAKGDSYSYVDDSTGNLVSATNLTNPDIVDQIKSITSVNGRTMSLYYDTEGLMSQMTDGDGSSATKTFKFAYDMTQGNKNCKLVSVTDPRGHSTSLVYYTAPQDPTFKWSLETITDRLSHATGFTYSVPSSGGIQTVVTDPKNNSTTYLADTSGRPVQSTNAKSQVTKLGWDSDNNVTSLTEDNGGKTTWTYDPNTGYPLTEKTAQANHDGTAGTTYTYQTALNGHVANLSSELTPQQRLWTFSYDSYGNLKTVTKPLGNASGAASGSYTTKYTYDSYGDLLTSTDPDGNTTQYGNFDANGYPQAITDPVCYAKQQSGGTCSPAVYAYNSIGAVTSVTDPMNNGTSTHAYDVFGRPLASTVPKTSTVSITTPAPVYDGNDNVTQSTAPNGAVTTYTFDNDDELSSKVTPPDTTGGTAPKTTYAYDADGNLHLVTAPKGNVSGAAANSYQTDSEYDTINELVSQTDPMGNTTHYGYDDVGNQASTATAKQYADGVSTQVVYNYDHKPTQVTDPGGNVTKTGYDLDGIADSSTDANGNQTLLTLDANGEVTQQKVPAQAPGAAVSYDVTQYVYDQAGNKTQVISPRASADGVTTTSACVATQTCPYTTVTSYTPDGQTSKVQTPYLPGDATYGTPAETDYTYNADGQLSQVSAPPSGSSTSRNVTSFTYFDNGQTSGETDPAGIKTSYDYNSLGEQSSRVLTSADGDLTRTMNWGYYPDGKLESISDDGIPTGFYAEVTQASDPGAATSGSWTTTQCGSTAGCEGTQYETHASGTGTDTFTWPLYVPADGNYTVYVKYPSVSGAAAGSQFTVSYSGGSSTQTVDQTKNAGTWVALGKYALTQSGKGQQVSLTESSGGTVVAGAVKIVRDNSGQANTAVHGYAYTYDPDGQQTGIADSSPGAAVANYVTTYDQDGRTASVEEDNSSGSAVHTTTYGYDADSNQASMTHDGAPSTYVFNDLEQLAKETDAKSSSDTSPQVSTFTYTPAGQVYTAVKPNGNTVTNTYYANEQPYTVTEKTSGGTLVSSHQYQYDPDGNTTQNVEQLMSADSSSSYLNHTLAYTYTPMDQVATVSTDGTQTESYTHDANNDVTAQTVNGTTTTYGYAQGQMATATVGGTTADYNYDPFGRLDTVTAAGQTIQSNTYDGFDHLASTTQMNASGTSTTTSYTYDSLNRMATQTTGAGTTSFSYLGLSSEVASEQDPGSASKTYDYTPGGARLLQDTTGGTGPAGYGYYSYNAHSDVEAVTGSSGTTTATYGYTAYGDPLTSMFTGADKSDATSSASSTTQPYSAYRFNAMRWDGTSGQYDMGFRNYDPGLNQFMSRDMYDGAAQNMGLTTDPFTGGSYAFGGGNPVSNIEMDGHMACAGNGSTGCLAPYGTIVSPMDGCSGGVNDSSCFAPVSSSPASSTGPATRGICGFHDACPGGGGAPSGPGPAGGLAGLFAGIGKTAVDGYCSILSPVTNALCGAYQGITGQSPSAAYQKWVSGQGIPVSGDSAYQDGQAFAVGLSLAAGPEGGAEDAAAAGAEDSGGILGTLRSLLGGCARGGESFTDGTKVLLASGKTATISSLRPGDKVLATNTKTGKTQAETVAKVEVNHDHDLYDLRVKSNGRDAVIHTTSNHLFWDPWQKQWRPAAKLNKGEHLKTLGGQAAVVEGGSTPAVHDGWMWDLTVQDDHDFYVLPARDGGVGQYYHVDTDGATAVLVHNCMTLPPTQGSGNAYSVAFETQLPASIWKASRGTHFAAANKALYEAMSSDPDFAAAMEEMIPGVTQAVSPGARGAFLRDTPSPLWTWHHAGDPGVMQLVPSIQHEAPGIWQTLFHPGGVGGYSLWGR